MIKKYFNPFIILLSLVTSLLITSCSKPVETAYQKQVAIPKASWAYQFQPEFEFNIPDTTSKYKVFLIFRYDEAYEFSNIWLDFKTKHAQDSVFKTGNRLETVLLATDGTRLGNNVGGMYEYKIQLTPGKDFPKFKTPGDYTVKLEQIMRKNPLVGLINIGLRVERYNAK